MVKKAVDGTVTTLRAGELQGDGVEREGRGPFTRVSAAETKAFLAERGVDLTGAQQTNTATALQFLSQELRGA